LAAAICILFNEDSLDLKLKVLISIILCKFLISDINWAW
jgi:hypothetical protein